MKQGPSEPINPIHPRVYEYSEHYFNKMEHPFPVVMQPTIQLLHNIFVFKSNGASEQVKSKHYFELYSHLHFLAPEFETLSQKIYDKVT